MLRISPRSNRATVGTIFQSSLEKSAPGERSWCQIICSILHIIYIIYIYMYNINIFLYVNCILYVYIVFLLTYIQLMLNR